jgi:hypothetical protein
MPPGYPHEWHSIPNGGPVVKLTRKIIFAILIGLSLFGAASAVAGATHASAATAIEYGAAS